VSLKLEKRIMQYEKSTSISNDEELLHAIEQILKEEQSLPPEEKDFDLVDEAIEMILSLKNVDIEQLDKVSEQVVSDHLELVKNKIQSQSSKNHRRVLKMKRFFPLAAVISLLAASTIIAYACGLDLASMTGDMFNQLARKVKHHNGDKDLIISDDSSNYKSLHELIQNEDVSNLLLPKDFPDGCVIDYIDVVDYGEYTDITLFMTADSSIKSFNIRTPYSYAADIETVPIGNYDVNMYDYDSRYHAKFEYGDSAYSIEASSYEMLETIILSLEKGE
jgi:hypothetical protein